MLDLVQERRNGNAIGWRRSYDDPVDRRPLSFELLPNRMSSNSATFSIYRAKIPGGWLVASRPSDTVAFVPDPQHMWDGGSVA